MSKKKTGKVLASMLCASVMIGLYSAPVFAAAPVTGDELKIEGSDGKFVIKDVVPGKTMIYTENKAGDDTLYLDPASGNLSTEGTISVGGLDTGSAKTVIDGTTGSIAVGLENGVPKINLDAATGEVNAKTFNGVSLATNGNEVLVGGIDVKAVDNNVKGIRRATKDDRASTYIEDTVRINNKTGLWVYEENGTTVAASIDREGNAKFNDVKVGGNVLADGVGRFGSQAGPNVRMENGELTINSNATNKVVSMSAEGLKMYGDDGKLNALLTRDGGLALNQNLSVGGNMSIDGTINGATITADSFNNVNIKELANSVEGLGKTSDNVAGITRPRENETIIEGKVAINSVGNIYTPGSVIAENGFSTGNGNFAVSGATGDIITAGTINGASIKEGSFNGVEIGNGLVDGVDVSELKGSFDKANENVAGITRKDGNTNIEGVLTVSADGLNAVKDNSAIDLNKDGAFLTSNGNMVFANANAAGLMADENNFISVSKNGIGLKGNVVFDSKNHGSVSLGSFYDEYKTNVGKFDEAIKDLQDKTQNIDKDKTEDGHTQIDGDLTVGDVNVGSGNINTGNVNAGNVNAGTVNADNVVVGDTTISKDGITSNKVTVGDTTIDKDGITSNKVTVGDTTVSKDSVNVGGENGTTVSKDGVTVGGENGTSVSKDDVVINKGTDKEVSLSNVGSRVDNLEQGLADANSRIDRVDEKIDKVGAMAAAIANLRTMGYDPEAPTEIAVGVGQYRSETGAALGFFHYPNKDFMLSMSVSTSGDEVMGGIGATWKFGRKTPAEMKAAKERAAEKAKLEKAAAIKKAAELAKVEKQQQRHAELAAKKAVK